jgi:hypothetical protein
MSGDTVEAEAAYYQAVEEFFVSRRGDPLFLSNADWVLVRTWRRGGIPLRVVLRGVADALDGHAHSWGRNRKVASLAYCASEVEAARDRWGRALGLGGRGGDDVGALLLRLADDLAGAVGLGPAAADAARSAAAGLRRRAESSPSRAALDAWLVSRERSLVEALRRDAGTEEVQRLDAAVDQGLAAYRGRLPGPVLAQIRTEAIARRLLEAHGLPRLSLFHHGGPE